jgi:hypothetical protein
MPIAFFANLLVLLSAVSPFASSAAAVSPFTYVDYESFEVIGWTKDCTVAVKHLGYPRVGDAIANVPVRAKIGTLTIKPTEHHAKTEWRIDSEGRNSWDPSAVYAARAALRDQGYVHEGWRETVRPDLVAAERDLPRLILTTDTFRSQSTDYPAEFPARWRMAEVHYSPLSAVCALLVFHDRKAQPKKPFFQYRLIRVDNPAIRSDRAFAHLTNGLILLNNGDRAGALQEAKIAAQIAPDDGLARYKHACLLALSGTTEAAFDELELAIKIDKRLKAKARGDQDFADVAWMPRFQELTR